MIDNPTTYFDSHRHLSSRKTLVLGKSWESFFVQIHDLLLSVIYVYGFGYALRL